MVFIRGCMQGYWSSGQRSGWGRQTNQRTGEVYEGAWSDDVRNGFGVVHFSNGDSFHGYFVDDLFQGDGISLSSPHNLLTERKESGATFWKIHLL